MNKFRYLSRILTTNLIVFAGVAQADMVGVSTMEPSAAIQTSAMADLPTLADALVALSPVAAAPKFEITPQTGSADVWPLPTAVSTSLSAAGSGERSYALAATMASSSLQLSLWQFITTVRAQQADRSFALLENNLRILELSSTSATGAVPLPGSAWFLVIGLLGFAGVQVTQRQDRRAAASGERSEVGAMVAA